MHSRSQAMAVTQSTMVGLRGLLGVYEVKWDAKFWCVSALSILHLMVGLANGVCKACRV